MARTESLHSQPHSNGAPRLPPHRFVLERRMAAAAELLNDNG
jgi:hypothetical protein